MYEKNFPVAQFANVLEKNIIYAGKSGQIQDAQLIYYYLVNKYDATHALDVLNYALELFRKTPHELNEIIVQIERKIYHV